MPGTATAILIDGTPTNYSDPWIDSLVGGGAWKDSDGGTVTIQWTAFQGTMDGQNSYGWTSSALRRETSRTFDVVASAPALANPRWRLSAPRASPRTRDDASSSRLRRDRRCQFGRSTVVPGRFTAVSSPSRSSSWTITSPASPRASRSCNAIKTSAGSSLSQASAVLSARRSLARRSRAALV